MSHNRGDPFEFNLQLYVADSWYAYISLLSRKPRDPIFSRFVTIGLHSRHEQTDDDIQHMTIQPNFVMQLLRLATNQVNPPRMMTDDNDDDDDDDDD